MRDLFKTLQNETRIVLSTNEAAYYLCRRPQTLRVWASYENGPIKPKKINGRLMWFVEDILKLLHPK